jgi:flavin-dependent dehydrogenase
MTAVTVIGGGIGGLVAAISAAEHGFDVALHESKAYLGGRAVTSSGAFHAIASIGRAPVDAFAATQRRDQ